MQCMLCYSLRYTVSCDRVQINGVKVVTRMHMYPSLVPRPSPCFSIGYTLAEKLKNTGKACMGTRLYTCTPNISVPRIITMGINITFTSICTVIYPTLLCHSSSKMLKATTLTNTSI